MAAGLPIVVWDLPDYRGYELQDQDHGFLLPPFDVELLAGRLESLAGDAQLRQRMGEEARRLASHFTLERSMAEHMELYRDLASP